MSTKVQIISPGELSSADRQHWLGLHRSDSRFARPQFHPDFSLAIAKARGDTRLAILEQEGRSVGYFPFRIHHRSGFGGSPTQLGGVFSNCESTFSGVDGPIADPGVELTICDWVYRSGLRGWNFCYLPLELLDLDAAQLAAAVPAGIGLAGDVAAFPAYRAVVTLADGIEGYRQRRRELGNESLKELARKERKLSKDLGEVRFAPNLVDHALLERLFQWKSRQCRQRGWNDLFTEGGWYLSLSRDLLERAPDGLSLHLSALYAGDQLAALTLDLSSRSVLEGFVTAYNPDLEVARYSPGGIIEIKLIEHAAATGLTTVDLGGYTDWKGRFVTDAMPFAMGYVCRPGLNRVRKGAKRVYQCLRRAWQRFPKPTSGGGVRI